MCKFLYIYIIYYKIFYTLYILKSPFYTVHEWKIKPPKNAHDRKTWSICHFKTFCGLLASGSIITLDAQKNAVHAICIFYTLQYSMILLYFCNLSFSFGVIVLQMQQNIDSYMRILDRMMYIDILFRCNNSYVCPACKK